MRTIRHDIEKDRALRKQIKSGRVLEPDATGRRFEEKGTGTRLIYCPTCNGPVVDSPRARAAHAQTNPRCLEAMGASSGVK